MTEPMDGQNNVVQQSIINSGIGELNLSVRARKCMTKLGVNTIGDLLRLSAKDLLEVRNFGVTSLNDVREALAYHNLHLSGE